jgi:hypothetical protein
VPLFAVAEHSSATAWASLLYYGEKICMQEVVVHECRSLTEMPPHLHYIIFVFLLTQNTSAARETMIYSCCKHIPVICKKNLPESLFFLGFYAAGIANISSPSPHCIKQTCSFSFSCNLCQSIRSFLAHCRH